MKYSLTKYFLKTGAIGVSALLVIEIVLRLWIWSPWPHFVVSKDMGRVVDKGTSIVRTNEGWGYTNYSEIGEVYTPYNSGPNIVVLGDSFTEATQVNDDAKYVSVAETLLGEDGKTFNLHNFGQGGLSIPDYVSRANFIKEHYSPVAIVIQINEDDFEESFSPRGNLFYFVVASNSLIEVKRDLEPESDRAFKSAWLRQSSALINYGITRFHEIQGGLSEDKNNISTESKGKSYQDTDFERQVSLALKALHDAYSDIPIILILLPNGPLIKNGRIELESDTRYSTIVSAAKESGWFHIVDPLDAFTKMAKEYQLPRGFANTIPGLGHLNAKGHRALAELLAEAIKETIH